MRLTESESRKTITRTAVKMVCIEQRQGKVSVSVVVGFLMLAMGVAIGTWIIRTSTEMTSNTPTAATNMRDGDVIIVAGQQAVPSLFDESKPVVSENDRLWRRQSRLSNSEEEHKLADFLSTPSSEVLIQQQQEQDVDVAALRSNIVTKQPQTVQPVKYNTEANTTFAERRKPKVQRDTPEELFAKSSACVVRVNIRNAQDKVFGHGSGFFVRDDSTVVTNFHVIDGANSAEVVLQDNTLLPVLGVQGFDAASDVAILKVARRKKRKVSHLSLELNPPPIGREVYVIGAPQGLDFTLSNGLVSGHREISGHTWIQVTAPISAGSSGSPVLNEDGLVIGIASMSRAEGQNLNIAAPAAAVNSLLIGNATLQTLANTTGTKQRVLDSIREVIEDSTDRKSFPGKEKHHVGETARRLLDQLDGSYHSLPEYWALKGDIAIYEEKFEAAIVAFQMAIQIDDGDSRVWYQVGWAHQQLALMSLRNKDSESMNTHYEKAAQAFRMGVQIAPEDGDLWHELGNCLDSLKHPQEAVVAWKRYLTINPNNAYAHSQFGNDLAELGDFEGGLAEYRIALELKPTDFGLFVNYGGFLQRGGRSKEAIRAFEMALTLVRKEKAAPWRSALESDLQNRIKATRSLDTSPSFPLGLEIE